MMDNIPPKVQNQIAQFQQLTQQIQMITTQKIQLEGRVKELERTVQELERAPEDALVFQSAGSLLIQTRDRQKLLADLKEQKENTEVRVKTLDRQDKHLRERHQTLQQQITQALQQGSKESSESDEEAAG